MKSFDRLVPFRSGLRIFLLGEGSLDGFFVVGNGPSPLSTRHRPIQTVRRPTAGGSIVTHTRIELGDISPGERIAVRIAEPQFGMRVRTYPSSAQLQLSWDANGLNVENVGDDPIRLVVLRAKLPISIAWFVLSLVAILGSCAALTYPRWARALGVRLQRIRRFSVSA